MKFHTVCNLFPEMQAEEFAALVEDIRANGVHTPAVTHKGDIIDGRHRWKACAVIDIACPTREWHGLGSLTEYVVSLNLKRRHLTASQKACIALDVLPLLEEEAKARQRGGQGGVLLPVIMPEATHGEAREKAAAAMDVSPRYVQDAKKLRDEAPEVLARVRSGELTIPEAKKEVAKVEREAARSHIPADLPPSFLDRCTLIEGDLAAVDVADASIDWIVTDPPYPAEFLPVYDKLEEFAATKLKPGGSLLCMIGQSYLPDILHRLSKGRLHYRWTLAYMTPGGQAVQLWARRVNTFWKPVLWLTRSNEDIECPWIGDVVKSDVNDNDKRFHGWGQSESGMSDLMRRFVKPGDVVCDPFLGGGTTALVALALNCRFIGIDIDPEALTTTRGRLHDVAR